MFLFMVYTPLIYRFTRVIYGIIDNKHNIFFSFVYEFSCKVFSYTVYVRIHAFVTLMNIIYVLVIPVATEKYLMIMLR